MIIRLEQDIGCPSVCNCNAAPEECGLGFRLRRSKKNGIFQCYTLIIKQKNF